MALFASYQLATVGTDLQVTVQWRTTQNGSVIQTDIKNYSLVDQAVIGAGAAALATRITNDFKSRAVVIDQAVQTYTGVTAAIGANQNTVFQVLP